MSINKEAYLQISEELSAKNITLVAVSKTKPAEEIRELYDLGHRDFGENYVQELTEKQPLLPADIRWHFIGHLQSNKVKYIAPFVSLVHGVDSLKLLKEINKQAAKNNRVVRALLQVHIAREETKFGLDENELLEIVKSGEIGQLENVNLCGLMGMASFAEDMSKVRPEFSQLKEIFERCRQFEQANVKFEILSMGMSADYQIAIEEGSNMVRIGSLLFGARN